METVFDKILSKEIPADIIYEDNICLAFKDINPQAPVHVLLIPKKRIATIQDATPNDKEILGHMSTKIPEIATGLGLAENGYRVVVNCKENGGQEVPHLHYHILGGRKLKWPPG